MFDTDSCNLHVLDTGSTVFDVHGAQVAVLQGHIAAEARPTSPCSTAALARAARRATCSPLASERRDAARRGMLGLRNLRVIGLASTCMNV